MKKHDYIASIWATGVLGTILLIGLRIFGVAIPWLLVPYPILISMSVLFLLALGFVEIGKMYFSSKLKKK